MIFISKTAFADDGDCVATIAARRRPSTLALLTAAHLRVRPGDQTSRFLIHDRDSLHRTWFRRKVKGSGTRCLARPPRSPQTNSAKERNLGRDRLLRGRIRLELPRGHEDGRVLQAGGLRLPWGASDHLRDAG